MAPTQRRAPASAERDLYELLGVPRDATLVAIRAGFRAKAVQLHPDKGGDPSAFAAVQGAYAVLSSSKLRPHYDATGRSELTPEEEFRSAMAGSQLAGADAEAELAVARQEPRPPWAAARPAAAAPAAPAWGADGQRSTQRPAAAAREVAWLPPALRAAVEGRDLEAVEVPPEFEVPVPHVTVSEREGGALDLIFQKAPPSIEDGHLREGEVLVQMRAVPLCLHDLAAGTVLRGGDTYGAHGVGQVRMVGPKVGHLAVGDWVVPLLEVDEEGDLKEDALPPGSARAMAVYNATRCARLALKGDEVLSVGQMALAKSLGAAYRMIEEHAGKLQQNDTVIVNAANGVVGQVLVQLLSALGHRVLAVVRDHSSVELTRRWLEGLGAAKAFLDDDHLKGRIEEMQVPLPELAFDGVGGEGTLRIASSLSKTGDLVCFGWAGGSRRQVLPSGWGKKWKGSVHQFSLDEWLQRDLEANSRRFGELIAEASKLLQATRLQLEVREYRASSAEELARAVEDARAPGRGHAVVLLFEAGPVQPAGGAAPWGAAATAKAPPGRGFPASGRGGPGFLGPGGGAAGQGGRPIKVSWDLEFLAWEEEEGEGRMERRQEGEGNLFKPDPVMDEMRIQRHVGDALAAPVALELGAREGEAAAVFLWLPGAREVPEEHGPWLAQLVSQHPGLRVLVLRPRLGTKWYDTSDDQAIQLGLRYGVLDDIELNPDGDPAKSRGNLMFPPLTEGEIEALQQVESASLGLARRCALEEEAMSLRRRSDGVLPFFLGGSGQGGSLALYTAICLLPSPVRGVAFCHSAVPVGAMLGKRMKERTRQLTELYGIYDRADREVPASFPEALHGMFERLGCAASLEWLQAGDGHDFCDAAAEQVAGCVSACLRPEFRKHMEAQASRMLREQTNPAGLAAARDRGLPSQQQKWLPPWELQAH